MRHVALAWVLAALGLLAAPAHAADTVYYYSSDTLHSEVVVTDANRNVVERTRYAPYGQVLDRDLRDGPGYTGHEEDPETSLVYMQQRYYDPEAGRFLSTDPVQADGNGGSFNRYAYAKDNPYRYTDPFGMCADHYKDGSCEVKIDAGLKNNKQALAAQKSLQGVLNKYDKAVNALADKTTFSITNAKGKVIGSVTGAEIKAVWNGTHFSITSKTFNNGGAGGGTGGTWHGGSFSGNSELSPRAVSDYANNAAARGEASTIGVSTLTFHELGHETHFGEALTQKYPVTPTISWPRERGASSAGDTMAGAAGAPFDCAIPGGCE